MKTTTQYVVICRKNGFGARIHELVSKRKKSFVTEGRKNNWSIFVFVFWLFSKSWLDGCRWVSLDRLASHQPPIPPTRENDDAKKIQGEYNLGVIFISARFCATFFLNQLNDTRGIQPGQYLDIIPHICHGRHGRRPCNFFLAGVNFYRFNAKNWQFIV